MELVLNNLKRLICRKTQTNKQTKVDNVIKLRKRAIVIENLKKKLSP